jgi:hypothetical protein
MTTSKAHRGRGLRSPDVPTTIFGALLFCNPSPEHGLVDGLGLSLHFLWTSLPGQESAASSSQLLPSSQRAECCLSLSAQSVVTNAQGLGGFNKAHLVLAIQGGGGGT